MPTRQLIILGGPNGAGKSSAHAELERLGFVTGPFLNPDNIARDLGGAPDTRDIRAGRETLRRAKLWIREGRTFTRESTLTSSEVLRSMRTARDAGYRVILVFVGIDSVEAGKARVRSRVLHGGHDIAPEAQERRFAKSFANARRAAAIVNTAYFVDNASSLRYVAWVEQGRVRFADGSRSPWLLPALEGLPRTETASMPRAKALALARHHERLPRHWRG